jgi:hypothetical protein
MPQKRTRRGVTRKSTDYSVKTYTIWMLDNKGKMTALDHRELFRLMFTARQLPERTDQKDQAGGQNDQT